MRAVIGAGAAIEGQFDRPIVRQIQLAPGAIVVFGARRAVAVTGFAEEESGRAIAEILLGIPGMSERKAPVLVDIDAFARRLRRKPGRVAGRKREQDAHCSGQRRT